MNYDILNNKRVKILIVIIISIFLFLLFLNLWQNNQHNGKALVEIYKVPKDTIVSVNGQKINKSTYLTPGKYTLKGESKGFETYTTEIEIVDDKPLKSFFVLTPSSKEAEEWAKNHEDDYLKIENLAGIYYGEEGQQLANKHPLIKHLPYRSTLYNIDYSLDGNKLTIQIDSPDALGRQVAIEQIKSFGSEPTDLNIEFIGHYSPFVAEEE